LALKEGKSLKRVAGKKGVSVVSLATMRAHLFSEKKKGTTNPNEGGTDGGWRKEKKARKEGLELWSVASNIY